MKNLWYSKLICLEYNTQLKEYSNAFLSDFRGLTTIAILFVLRTNFVIIPS